MFSSIVEIIFDASYLIAVFILGALIITKANDSSFKIFGVMAIVLVLGDSFHLVPRIYALATDGLSNHMESLGFGKFIASISMTIFYVLLYHFAVKRYQFTNKLMFWIYLLAISRIVLCLFPQNGWQLAVPSLNWAVYRNIPFIILGILMIALFYKLAYRTEDLPFKYLWLAISLSFGFYLPVVLFSDRFPIVGVLMIPKTMAYVWIIWMGWQAVKRMPSPQNIQDQL